MNEPKAKFINGKCVSFSEELISADNAEKRLKAAKESAPVMVIVNDGERIEWLTYGGEKNGTQN